MSNPLPNTANLPKREISDANLQVGRHQSNKITTIVREAMADSSGDFLQKVILLAKREFELYAEAQTAYESRHKLIEMALQMEDATPADKTKAIQAIVSMSVTFPPLENVQIYKILLLKCLPQLKSIDVKTMDVGTMFRAILSMDAKAARSFLDSKKDISDLMRQEEDE